MINLKNILEYDKHHCGWYLYWDNYYNKYIVGNNANGDPIGFLTENFVEDECKQIPQHINNEKTNNALRA